MLCTHEDKGRGFSPNINNPKLLNKKKPSIYLCAIPLE